MSTEKHELPLHRGRRNPRTRPTPNSPKSEVEAVNEQLRDIADVPAIEIISSAAIHMMSAAAVKCGLAADENADDLRTSTKHASSSPHWQASSPPQHPKSAPSTQHPCATACAPCSSPSAKHPPSRTNPARAPAKSSPARCTKPARVLNQDAR